jgi:hypothetical protein
MSSADVARLIVMLAALGSTVPALAQQHELPTDPIFRPQLGMPDDEDEPERLPPPSPPELAADQIEELRRSVVGKPVYGYRTGKIGEVVSLATDGRGQPSAIVVRLDPAVDPRQGFLPVLWRWMAVQADMPTFVVPWSAAQVRWLVGGAGG